MAFVKSADRVIQIFEAIGFKDNGMTHGELYEVLGIPKGSLSLLLSNLVTRNFLSLHPVTKRYKFGMKLLSLMGRHLASLDIVRAGQPVIQELAEEINEDVEIAVMDDFESVFVCIEQSVQPLKFSVHIGQSVPMYATASGKAILAHLSETQLFKYFSAVELVSVTKNTLTDPELLKCELENIRSSGIAHNYEEHREGLIGMAAPIFNFRRKVEGSVVVILPSIRFTPKQKRFIEHRLRGAAAKISSQLGFEGTSN